MGETYDQVQKEINRVPYKVVRGDNNTRVDIEGRLYTPQEISAMVLQKMKKTAEDYLGQEVTDAKLSLFRLTLAMLSVRLQKKPVKLPV